MEELLPKDHEKLPLPDDPPLPSSERPGFTPDQMVRCEECLRANPPIRSNCLYCAAPLPFNEATANLQRPTLRRLEKWESGYNNILVAKTTEGPSSATLAEVAGLLNMNDDTVNRILSVSSPMPLARTATPDEAALVKRRLQPLGIQTRIISDQELTSNVCTEARVRAFDIDESGIRAFQVLAGDELQLNWDQLVLFVTGRLINRRIEIQERKGGAENEILDASEFVTDEAVLDIYTDHQQVLRIMAHSFDFSCLQDRKSLIAGENLSTLLDLLCKRAPEAGLDHSYNVLRPALESVWPIEQSVQSRGWRREWPGKYSIGATTETNNEPQFTRYSRLRYYFRINRLDHPG